MARSRKIPMLTGAGIGIVAAILLIGFHLVSLHHAPADRTASLPAAVTPDNSAAVVNMTITDKTCEPNPRTVEAASSIILRRPFNFSRGVTRAGRLDMGLLFVCFQSDLERGFVAVQQRLNGEPLEEYIKPVGGGFFFVPPGVQSQSGYLGEGLFAMV